MKIKNGFPTKPRSKRQLESWGEIVEQFREGDSIRRIANRYRFAEARVENMIRFFVAPGGHES